MNGNDILQSYRQATGQTASNKASLSLNNKASSILTTYRSAITAQPVKKVTQQQKVQQPVVKQISTPKKEPIVDVNKLGQSFVAGAKTLPGMAKQAGGIIFKNIVDTRRAVDNFFKPVKAVSEAVNSLFLNNYQKQARKEYLDLEEKAKNKGLEMVDQTSLKMREEGQQSQAKAQQEYAKTYTPSKNASKYLEMVAYNAPQVLASMGLTTATAIITKNPALATAVGLSSSYGLGTTEVYNEARQNGLSDKQALPLATMGGAIIGAIDFIPLERLIRKTGATETVKKSIIKKIASTIVSLGTQSGFEGITEGIQEIIGNAVASTYKENQDLFEGVKEAAIVGALLGGLGDVTVGGIVGLLGRNASDSDVISDVEGRIDEAIQTSPDERTEEQKQIVDSILTEVVTPGEAIAKVTSTELENTPTGKAIVREAIEAKQENKNIVIKQSEEGKVTIEKVDKNYTPIDIEKLKTMKPSTPQIEQKKSPEEKKLSKAQEYVKSKKTKFRVEEKYKKELLSVHNMSASGIDKANIEGGIPAPSLAITKKNIPFSDFGEISLIGDKNLVDPTRPDTNVFSGDIYTPRVPQAEYAPKSLYKTPLGDEFKKRGVYFGDFDSLSPYQAIERLVNARENPYTRQEAEKIINDIYSEPFLTVRRKVFGPDLQELIKDTPSLAKVAKEARNAYDFRLTVDNEFYYHDAIQELADKKFNGEYYDALDKIEKDLFEQVPYNVENKVRRAKELIGRNLDDIRGTEQGWGQGANPRIFGYDKLSSIEEIKGAKGTLMSKEKAQAIGKKNEDALFAYLNKNKMGMDYTNSLEIFKDIVKANKYDDAAFIKRDLSGFGDFEKITLSQAKEIGRLLKLAYKNVPTDYFEAKLMRPVLLSEFKGALVPEDTKQETLNILRKNGLKIVQYDSRIEGDRAKKMKENFKEELFRIKDDFKRATGITITNKQEAEIIKLNKKIFGDEDIKITEQILANNKALGSYFEGIIKIIEGQANPKDTYLHEAVHKYLDVMLDEQEHVDLLMEASKLYGIDDFTQVEEKIAEDFIQYSKDSNSITGKIKSFLEKLLKRIRIYVKNKNKIQELYDEILAKSESKSEQKQVTPQQAKSIITKANKLLEEGNKIRFEQTETNESIEIQLEGLSSQALKDIATLKRMKSTKEGQEGDIETLYKKSPEVTSRVIEAIRMWKRDYENDTKMTDEEAVDIALSLPSKSEKITSVPDQIKKAKQLIKESGIKITKEFEEISSQSYEQFEKDFIESNATLVKEKLVDMAEVQKLYKNIVEISSKNMPTGEGKQKVSRLEARMRGVMGNITEEQIETLGLSTYKQMNREDTIANAAEYVINNQEKALDVLRGSIDAPKGIPPEAIYVALTKMADQDITLATKLASLQATAIGQRISLLAEIDKDSPVKILNDIYKIREAEFNKKYKNLTPKKAKDNVVASIKKEIRTIDKYDWNAFINSIEC